MTEHNKDILKKAIKLLPSYEAPQAVWKQLNEQLQDAQSTVLLEQLPTYSPPSEVWNQINKHLGQANKTKEAQRPIRQIYANWRMRAASVAAAVLLFSAGYFFASWQGDPKVSMAIRQEQGSSIGAVKVDWNDEEDRFQYIMNQLENINDPKLNMLRAELEDLSKAKQEVEQMLREYGQDNHVIRQLAEIETQRSQVYRQVINEL